MKELARLLGSRGGIKSSAALSPEQRSERASKAGKACAEKMTPEQRQERARKAGMARKKKTA